MTVKDNVERELEEHDIDDLDLGFFDGNEGYVPRTKQWLLISGSRRKIIAALLVVVFCAFVAMSFVWSDFAEMLSPNTESNLSTLFTQLLSGVILLVSIVTSVNSLSVSQELTPVGEQHERVVKSWDFRERAAEITDQKVSPPVPASSSGRSSRRWRRTSRSSATRPDARSRRWPSPTPRRSARS